MPEINFTNSNSVAEGLEELFNQLPTSSEGFNNAHFVDPYATQQPNADGGATQSMGSYPPVASDSVPVYDTMDQSYDSKTAGNPTASMVELSPPPPEVPSGHDGVPEDLGLDVGYGRAPGSVCRSPIPHNASGDGRPRDASGPGCGDGVDGLDGIGAREKGASDSRRFLSGDELGRELLDAVKEISGNRGDLNACVRYLSALRDMGVFGDRSKCGWLDWLRDACPGWDRVAAASCVRCLEGLAEGRIAVDGHSVESFAKTIHRVFGRLLTPGQLARVNAHLPDSEKLPAVGRGSVEDQGPMGVAEPSTTSGPLTEAAARQLLTSLSLGDKGLTDEVVRKMLKSIPTGSKASGAGQRGSKRELIDGSVRWEWAYSLNGLRKLLSAGTGGTGGCRPAIEKLVSCVEAEMATRQASKVNLKDELEKAWSKVYDADPRFDDVWNKFSFQKMEVKAGKTLTTADFVGWFVLSCAYRLRRAGGRGRLFGSEIKTLADIWNALKGKVQGLDKVLVANPAFGSWRFDDQKGVKKAMRELKGAYEELYRTPDGSGRQDIKRAKDVAAGAERFFTTLLGRKTNKKTSLFSRRGGT